MAVLLVAAVLVVGSQVMQEAQGERLRLDVPAPELSAATPREHHAPLLLAATLVLAVGDVATTCALGVCTPAGAHRERDPMMRPFAASPLTLAAARLVPVLAVEFFARRWEQGGAKTPAKIIRVLPLVVAGYAVAHNTRLLLR